MNKYLLDVHQTDDFSSEEYNTNYSDDGYESDEEMKLEIIDYENSDSEPPKTEIYSVSFKPIHSNRKRLICYSTINNENCSYGDNCTYAHSLEEQVIDHDKKYIYQIVLDKNLMNFYDVNNPKTDEIYKYLLFLTRMCDVCIQKKCTGGYNCKYGVSHPFLKLCKNDLLMGECRNRIVEIPPEKFIIDKIKSDEVEIPDTYYGCLNGHHLTNRNLVPYYKYDHEKESVKKNKYQSVRYIDLEPAYHIVKSDNYYNLNYKYNPNMSDTDSESDTDEEINSWFQIGDDGDLIV